MGENGKAPKEVPFFTVTNRHFAGRGVPPRISSENPHQTVSYFEGYDQWAYVHDSDAKTATLYGGDIGWERALQTTDGAFPSLVLDAPERHWIAACWAYPTHTPVQEVLDRHADQHRAYLARAREAVKGVLDLLDLQGPNPKWRDVVQSVRRLMGEPDADDPTAQSQLYKMLEEAGREFDVVVTADWSRLTRSAATLAVIEEAVARRGGQIQVAHDE